MKSTNRYQAEVGERWGDTEAYREYKEKTKSFTKEKYSAAIDAMNSVFAELASCKDSGASPNSDEVQSIVAKLQAYITENFYTCTKEILSCLGQMYISDERFKENIDRQGEGTAAFAAKAIAVYCN